MKTVVFLIVSVFLASQLGAQPRITSTYPVGLRQGARLELQVRGTGLAGAYGVWFDCEALQGKVQRVEQIETDEKEKEKEKKDSSSVPAHKVTLEVTVSPEAIRSVHSYRLITPGGVSNPLPLLVNSEPLLWEANTPNNTPATAQLVSFSGSSVLNGRTSNRGEVDYYALEVPAGQELRLEVLTGSGLLYAAPAGYADPDLFVCEPAGSWFDPERCNRMLTGDESEFFLFPKSSSTANHYLPRIRHQFEKAGRYLVAVGASQGDGGPDHAYQLRIVPVAAAKPSETVWYPYRLAHHGPGAWQERDYKRRLTPDWLEQLRARAVPVPKDETKAGSSSVGGESSPASGQEAPLGDKTSSLLTVAALSELEPNDAPGGAAESPIPRILEGVIDRPGDVDFFKLRVAAGEKLVFEIETPGLNPPDFTPRLTVLDKAGREVANNVYRKIAGDGDDWIKSLEPKTMVTFEEAGEYYLQIRELTDRFGDERFRYRVLVRPRIPHFGEIAAKPGITAEANEDRITLVPGAVKKLTIISAREEGFDGDIVLSVENLPPGVELLPSSAAYTEVPSEPGPVYETRGAVHKERYRPERLLTTLYLRAKEDAASTSMPRFIRLTASAVAQGRVSAPVTVQEIPLMVVMPEKKGTKKL